MGLMGDLSSSMKKVEDTIHKADVDQQVRDIGQEINRTGHDLSLKILYRMG